MCEPGPQPSMNPSRLSKGNPMQNPTAGVSSAPGAPRSPPILRVSSRCPLSPAPGGLPSLTPSSLCLRGRLGRTRARLEKGGPSRSPALHRRGQPHGKRKLLPFPLCGRTDGTSRSQLSHCLPRGGSAQGWLLSPRLRPALVSLARPPWRVRAGLALQPPLPLGFQSPVSPITWAQRAGGRSPGWERSMLRR